MAKKEAFLQFLKAARSLQDRGLSKEAIVQFAKNEFGELSELFKKQIDSLFKPKKGIENIKIKDEVFDDTVIKLPVDDTGVPFNPKDPTKQYGKPKKSRMLDEDEIAELDMDIGGLEYTNDFDGTVESANKLRKERAKYIADMELEYKKGNLDPEPGSYTPQRKKFLQDRFNEMEASGDNRLMTRDEVEELSTFDLQTDMDKAVEKSRKKDATQKKIIKDFDPGDRDPSAEGGIIGYYTGGMVDVEPNLSDIGHGSDALMARTRLVSPDGQATTSTGLNYLLAEDNDNIRVPFSKGKAATKGLSYLMDLFKPKPKVIFDEKRFREGPVTTEFLENINKKDLEPFIRSRDTMGPGGYGMYDDFADMPSGLQAAELISRIKGPRNTINYEAAEMFIGKKLKGNESVNELIEMLVEKKAEGGRIGFSKGKLADAARRKFMKTAGAAGAGIAALKTGLIGLGEKAAPVVEKTVEYTAPALNKIVETVMSVGDLMSQSGRRLKELTTKKKFKDIEVEEDMIDGPSYTIKKDGETIYYRPGKQDESGGFEDDIIEVIDETITKKASGGIARMIGE